MGEARSETRRCRRGVRDRRGRAARPERCKFTPPSGRRRPWHTSALRDNHGHAIEAREKQRSVAYLAGVSAGLDIKLLQLSEDTIDKWDLVLSVGLKRVYTGPMESPEYVATVNNDVHASTVHVRVRIWQPFLSIGLAGRSKPRPVFPPATESALPPAARER